MSLILPSLSQLHEQKLTVNDQQRIREVVDHAFETLDDLQLRKLVRNLCNLVSGLVSHGVESLPPKAQPGLRKILGDNDVESLRMKATIEPVLQEINASLSSQPLVSTGVARTRGRAKRGEGDDEYDSPAAPPWRSLVQGLVVALLFLVAFYYTFQGAVYALDIVFADMKIGHIKLAVGNAGRAGIRRDRLQRLGF